MGQSINSSRHNYCVIYFSDLFSLTNTLRSETVIDLKNLKQSLNGKEKVLKIQAGAFIFYLFINSFNYYF